MKHSIPVHIKEEYIPQWFTVDKEQPKWSKFIHCTVPPEALWERLANFIGSTPPKVWLYGSVIGFLILTAALVGYYHPKVPHERMSQTEMVQYLSEQNVELMKKRGLILVDQPQLHLAVEDKQRKLNDAQNAYSGALNAYTQTVEKVLSIDAQIANNNDRIQDAVNLTK